MTEQSKALRSTILTGLMAAVIVVTTMITIPMPTGVPITLQTFGIALCGYVLGWKFGMASVGTYIVLGAVGLPVFSGFQGGFAPIIGVTGGFMWGFILMALLCGLSKGFNNKAVKIALGICGLLLCHAAGVIQFSLVTGTPFWTSVLTVSVPYLIKDVISVAAAYAVSVALGKALSKIAVT